ncbi:hypothetical protein NEF87_001807 [Candidatus Lokiarchaeum ossiferum]|uniref:Uncharacterized protein n=1 Tax=Candidatus Lokiarchaeum ossiferum TaxID=2951803 RepID=A0ABY6HRM5_9ARCH|nr:hypothetical protein NEF87_001807 [Candidatus Lokiarchaeum sp. B-35]
MTTHKYLKNDILVRGSCMTEQAKNNMVSKDDSKKKTVKEKLSKGQKNIQDLGVEELSKANFSLLLNMDGLDKETFFKSDKKPFTS